MKSLIRHKIIDKSVLTDGITLPQEVNQQIYDNVGQQLKRGDKLEIKILIDNHEYPASLKNMNNSREARTNDQLQLRWAVGNIGKKMRSLFKDSKPKLINDDGGAIRGTHPDIREYFNIYALDSKTFLFDCHMRLSEEDYELCKDNFTYLAAAKAKPFLILGGFSGTGKSQKVKELGYLTCPDIDDLQKGHEPGNYCLISVKPNWHDSTELLGYYSNIGHRYMVTDFIKFLVKAMKYPDIPFYVCMDEMNLAPVEEYFAEYLSVLETRTVVDGMVVSSALISKDVFKNETIFEDLGTDDPAIKEELRQNGLRLPQNVIVIGTVNMDDTTNSFSRKVIDRAMTFETKIDTINSADYFNVARDTLAYKNISCPERFICDEVRVLDVLKDGSPDFDLATEEKDKQTLFTDFINEINKAIGQGANYNKKDGLGVSPFQVSYRVLNEAVLYYRALKVSPL